MCLAMGTMEYCKTLLTSLVSRTLLRTSMILFAEHSDLGKAIAKVTAIKKTWHRYNQQRVHELWSCYKEISSYLKWNFPLELNKFFLASLRQAW